MEGIPRKPAPTSMSRLVHRFALVACLAWAASGCETTAPYEYGPTEAGLGDAEVGRPAFTVGDEFWFDTRGGSIFVEVFAGEDNGRLVFRRDLQQETFLYTPDLALIAIRRPFGSDQRFDPHDGRLEFPLKVGKTWARTFRVSSTDAQRTVQRTRRCEVIDAGQASVPAGRFAALRIECTLRELGASRVVREEVVYAPAVGRIIAHSTRDRSVDVRLTEFSRAP